jgi:hypothetical protein
MAYIGQGIKQGTFKVLDTSGNTYNGSNATFSLGTQVGSAAQLLVSHDGVIQLPGTDYTLASGGASITFSTAPASGASIFIIEISGAVGGTVTPSDTSVTADKLNTALLTGHTDIGAAIADADLFLIDDGAGGTLRKTAASRIKTYAGFSVSDITGATELAEAPADTDEFIISDAGTLKRIDYSYIKGEVNTPAFLANRSSGAGISSGSTTIVQPDNEVFDTDSAYNPSDGKFTVPSGKAGKYFIAAGVYFGSMTDGATISCEIYINNSAKALNRKQLGADGNVSIQCVGFFDLSASDYVTFKVDQNTGGSKNTSGDHLTFLSGFRVA